MPAFVDNTGQRFGRLIALTPVRYLQRPMIHWRCRCDCGNEIIASGGNLRSGHTQSCGCMAIEGIVTRSTVHGHALRNGRHALYRVWTNMINRCENPKYLLYYRYGGRGISVCERWRTSFANFLADMGDRPLGTSIDRIDNDLGYSPENCKWSTPQEQANNRGGKRAKK